MGSLRGGHYTATVLSDEDNTWYEFDNTRVSEVRFYLICSIRILLIQHIPTERANLKFIFVAIVFVVVFFVLCCRLKSSRLPKPGLTSRFDITCLLYFISNNI